MDTHLLDCINNKKTNRKINNVIVTEIDKTLLFPLDLSILISEFLPVIIGDLVEKFVVNICNENSINLRSPCEMVVGDNMIFISDRYNGRIVRLDNECRYILSWNSGSLNNQFGFPSVMVIHNSLLYVVNNSIMITVFDFNGKFVREFKCSYSGLEIAIYNSELYALSLMTKRIDIYTLEGKKLNSFRLEGGEYISSNISISDNTIYVLKSFQGLGICSIDGTYQSTLIDNPEITRDKIKISVVDNFIYIVAGIKVFHYDISGKFIREWFINNEENGSIIAIHFCELTVKLYILIFNMGTYIMKVFS